MNAGAAAGAAAAAVAASVAAAIAAAGSIHPSGLSPAAGPWRHHRGSSLLVSPGAQENGEEAGVGGERPTVGCHSSSSSSGAEEDGDGWERGESDLLVDPTRYRERDLSTSRAAPLGHCCHGEGASKVGKRSLKLALTSSGAEEGDTEGSSDHDDDIAFGAEEDDDDCVVSEKKRPTTRQENRYLQEDGVAAVPEQPEMTDEHITALEGIGFEWIWGATVWDTRLQELQRYKAEHGHCNVPNNKKRNRYSQLGNWVMHQRYHYKLLQRGKKSEITAERISALERIGFEWIVKGVGWETRLKELCQYKAEHGHCNVPKKWNENQQLANWVKNQRTHYRYRQEGISGPKKTPITDRRVAELERIGFEWSRSQTQRVQKLSRMKMSNAWPAE